MMCEIKLAPFDEAEAVKADYPDHSGNAVLVAQRSALHEDEYPGPDDDNDDEKYADDDNDEEHPTTKTTSATVDDDDVDDEMVNGDYLDDRRRDKDADSNESSKEEPVYAIYSPANLDNQMLVATAFPGVTIMAYLEESVVVTACSLVETVVCVHFESNTAAALVYTLHYFESDNPGAKGLDIGFRRPKEFYYEQEMDRPLWGTAYMTQVAINNAYLRIRNKDNDNVTKITVKAFPVPDFPENIVRYRYGLFWLAAATFLFPMYQIIARLCAENNSGLREYQLMMGLGNCFYWSGHFSCALCFFVVHSAVCVYSTVGHAQSDTGAAYLDRTDPSLLFVALLVHSVSQILLAMLAASVFTSVAAAMVSTVIVSVALPYWVLQTTGCLETLAQFVFGVRVTMMLSSALPTVAAFNVLTILAIQNDFDGGAVWQKVHYTTLGVVPITVVNVWAVSAVTMAVMILLIGYFSHVLPWNTALPLHPLFFFELSYWRPREVQYRPRTYALDYYDRRFERAPSYLKAALTVMDLSVTYGNNEALKGVSLQAFHKQATVLVGRNGAGKTTLMNAVAEEDQKSERCPEFRLFDKVYQPVSNERVVEDVYGATN
ncbi:uncharacterized protein LOC142559281 [Dermacentor variabilis]|uniref:uncharacterized protein LOC142559281 n=1 Tax=Dermacentor variabilis TaxID=34621 RepID=UPI003F5BF06F